MNHLSGAPFKRLLVRVSLAAMLVSCPIARAAESNAADIMPYARQNAIVQRQCGGCHTDALRQGGLSLQHFDATHVDPSLAAMLVSKVTNGYSAKEVNAADNPEAEAKMLALIKIGAMTAGGALPDDRTQLAFVRALSVEAGAEQWHSDSKEDAGTKSLIVTATLLRQLPSTKFEGGRIDMYRLIVDCRMATREGEIKLAWANGVPDEGREIMVAVDGTAAVTHKVEGGRKQGNGTNGPGSTVLQAIPFPSRSLTISNVFSDETIVFSFDSLSAMVRRDLSTCFSHTGK